MAYALIANDIDVYMPDSNQDNYFMASTLVCNKCNAYWHMPLLECYFCGELNYYLYTCTACGEKYSITNSGIKCTCRKSNSVLVKACLNESCPSNNIPEIEAIAQEEGGIFELNGSLNLALNHCVKCGNPSNIYKSHRIFIFNSEKDTNLEEFVKQNTVSIGDLILFRSYVDENIMYDFLKIASLDDKTYVPNYRFDQLSTIVDKVFGNAN